jgi:hypothetical protein
MTEARDHNVLLGAGGAGGARNGNAMAGGAGGNGVVLITEYFQWTSLMFNDLGSFRVWPDIQQFMAKLNHPAKRDFFFLFFLVIIILFVIFKITKRFGPCLEVGKWQVERHLPSWAWVSIYFLL